MFISKSPAETEAAGARLAAQLKPREVVALVGDLGAGKTKFVKGIARGLQCPATVTSPTFTLLHEYRGGVLPLYHFDFYRIKDRDALHAIGFEDYVESDGVTVIEWADKLPDALPADARWVRLEFRSANERVIDLPQFR